MTDSKFKILTTILILVFLSYSGVAQNKDGEETEKLKPFQVLRKAKISEKSGDIFSAIDYYKIYHELKPNKVKIEDKLGNLLLQEKNYKEAKKYLLRSYKADSIKYQINLFNYAQCIHSIGEYDEALLQYQKFVDEARRNPDLREIVRLARDIIEVINAIPELKENQIDVIINLLDTSINKPHIEFAPIPYENDKLIYGSLKQDELIYYDPLNEELPVRRLYMAKRENGNWHNLGEFDTIINHPIEHTGNGAFSFDKQRFYFSRCYKDYNHKLACRILFSKFENNEWQEPEELPEIINLPFTINTMPALGVSRNNTDMLYFVSDREEGRGGLDIWFTYFDARRNEWREPRNLGRRINTIGDEISPYYNIETKTLYFSSNGHPGFGGFDIFKSFGEARRWEDAVNIGYPINTSYDEQYYILTENRSRGFFTSNRPGGYSLRHETCCDDIYEFIYRDYINIAVTGQIFGITDTAFYNSIHSDYVKDMHINVDIKDKADQLELLYNYPINLFMLDKNTNKELFVRTDYTTPGHYFFNLEQGRDYFLTVKDYNKLELRIDFTTKEIFKSDTIQLDAIVVNTLPTNPIIVKNVYYEFGSSELADTARMTIENTIFSIMKEYPNIVVEISSHTDSVGTKESNILLSQLRAQSVVDFLAEKGIAKDRLIAKGYGEEKPIAPNSNPDGSDNPEGRAMNRRTEFRIIGLVQDYIDIIYEE